jgi:hypothetical protein
MEDNNALFVFDCLLRDNAFMCIIDEYISNVIFIAKTVDAKSVPQLVLILITLIKRKTSIDVEKTLKNDGEMQNLFEIFYTYIVGKIKENPNLNEFDDKEFKKSYEICVRLAILKFKFKNKNALACCGRGN